MPADPPGRDEDSVVDVVAGLVPHRDAPVVVAVDGRSGSGKTTVATGLAARLGVTVPDVRVVSLECLYRGWDGLEAGTRLWSRHVLPALATGRAVTIRPWDWHAGREGAPLTVDAADVVVAEGVGAGVADARDRIDLLVWLEAPVVVRRDRALARDGDTFAPWWDRWAAQEDDLYAADPVAGHADVVVDTAPADGSHWRVLAGLPARDEDDRP